MSLPIRPLRSKKINALKILGAVLTLIGIVLSFGCALIFMALIVYYWIFF